MTKQNKVHKFNEVYLDLSLIWQLKFDSVLDRVWINGVSFSHCKAKDYKALLKAWLEYKEPQDV